MRCYRCGEMMIPEKCYGHFENALVCRCVFCSKTVDRGTMENGCTHHRCHRYGDGQERSNHHPVLKRSGGGFRETIFCW